MKHPLKKCWIKCFCQHHNDIIQSMYLHNIDNSKHIMNNSHHFQHYVDHVNIQSNKIHIYLLYIELNQFIYK